MNIFTYISMVTKVAVVLAILTVGYLEIKLYTILPNYFSNDYCLYIIKWWKRFIDDCFILWKKSENLQLFEELLNTLHPLIKFTKEEGDANISFWTFWLLRKNKEHLKRAYFTKRRMLIDILFLRAHIRIKLKEIYPTH